MYNQFLPSIGPLPNQIKSNHHSESNVLSWFFTLTFNFFSIESTLCDISLLIPLYLFHPSPGWPISYTCSALLQASNRQDQGITAFYSAKLGWVPTGPFLFMNTNLQKEKKRKKKKKPNFDARIMGSFCIIYFILFIGNHLKFISIEWKFSKILLCFTFSKVSHM